MANNPLAAIEKQIAEATKAEDAERWVRVRKDYLSQDAQRTRSLVSRWVFSVVIAALLLLGLWKLITYY